MVLVFYISGHGFGHASRDVEVINAFARRLPEVRIVLRTTVPRWFLDSTLETRVEIVNDEVDTGVVQPDALTIDEEATARRAAAFYATFDDRVTREVGVLRSTGATLVVGDIPPLAFAAAARLGIPSAALANFTWDWIYEGFPGFRDTAPGVIETIADGYSKATLSLRMPFWGGFASMRDVEELPLVCRPARLPRTEVRRQLGLETGRPLVLASFGGHGGAVPLDRAVSARRFTIVATDYEWPDPRRVDGLRIVDSGTLRANGISYTDLLAACDVVATKVGYGIVAECIVNGVSMLYGCRGRFVEQEVFDRELPHVLRSRHISRDDLVEGRWADAVDALLAQPWPSTQIATNGADVAADRLASFAAAS
jgi:hypothetical protein